MAATVLSGSSNVTYTNTTGQNVRVVINYMRTPTAMTWTGGASITNSNVLAIGRNLAYNTSASSGNNLVNIPGSDTVETAFPTEIMLATGQTFSATCTTYNIIIIPEAG